MRASAGRTAEPATRGSWTPRLAVERALEVLCESGPRLLARKIVAELFYRRVVVFEARLDVPRPEIRSQLPLRFEVLGSDQIGDYLACLPGADPYEVDLRITIGDRCLAARLNGEVVAVQWVAFRDARLPNVGATLPISDGDAYLYGAYTSPRWRRMGINSALRTHVFDRLQAEGYRRVVSAWIPENKEAGVLKPSRGRPVTVLGAIGIGPWRRPMRPRPPTSRDRFLMPLLGENERLGSIREPA